MKIAVFEVEEWERSAFEELESDHELVYRADELTPELAEEVADADVISTFIYSDGGEETLSRFQDLKLIATRSTGYDHIDMDHCGEAGIAVAVVPDYGANTVAEHAFGLLLAISHRIVQAVERTRRGDFSQDGLRGFDLQGRVLGVVGTGDIGEHMLRIGSGFGMELLAFDVVQKDELADDVGFDYVELDDLLARSDVISLHVPLNDQTRNMLSADQFDRMKDGVVLLNTARGELVDVQALTDAMASGKVAAAGLDVLPEEPAVREEAELLRPQFRRDHDVDALLANHVLLRQENVLVTPHSAFNTKEAVEQILNTTVDNIAAFARGEPENLVNEDG